MNNPLTALAGATRQDLALIGGWLTVMAALVIGVHAAGLGIDYVNFSVAATKVFDNGFYDPLSVLGGDASFPPYVYSLFAPLAHSQAGSLLSLVMNVAAPVVLVKALGGPKEAGFLLALTPQSVANLMVNNLQWVALFGFALLAWTARGSVTRWAGVSAGAGFMLMMLRPDQLVLTPGVLAVRNRLAFVVACGGAAALLGVSFLVYGFWLPVWLEYLIAVPLAAEGMDSLLVTLQRMGVPAQGMLVIQAAILLDSVRYLWRWRAHADPRLSFVVALAAANVAGMHANIISTLPMLAVTLSLIPLRWSLALAGVGWAYAASFSVTTGQFVVGYYGLVPVACVVLAVVAVRRTGVKL